MKLSETLFSKVNKLWDEAAHKDFVVQMAKGTLGSERFKHYMIQDYLYLTDYIDVLNKTKELAESDELISFIENIIKGTTNETVTVHIPNMKRIGITDDDIKNAKKEPVIEEYVSYMKGCLNEHGLLAGLTALLQCSWVYAYIGQKDSLEFKNELVNSEYKDWFEAYSGEHYVKANQRWVEVLDTEFEKYSKMINQSGLNTNEQSKKNSTVNVIGDSNQDMLLKLCEIFEKCAEFENRFWDVL